MNYDFYVNFWIKNKEDVDNLTKGSDRYAEISDVLSRISLLITAYGNEPLKDYAKVGERNYPMGLKALIHSNGNYNDYLPGKVSELNLIGINSPVNIGSLPQGSWILEFPVTLKKEFLSKDDVPLYIIDNPVRKDKVFGIPFTSAMAWKGNLRWTMMKVFLEPITDNPEKFARIRFRHTLLFGTEKGWERKPTGWAEYLDNLCSEAKEKYRSLLKDFVKKEAKDVHLQGMLYFYPTFWDRIDMMVINPHDRKTKTGKNPIYYEVVPKGAKGVFRLLYVPLYHLGSSMNDLKRHVLMDLENIVEGLKAMMLTYGFSAKKSSGYGVIEDGRDRKTSRLEIKGFSNTVRFSDFRELEKEAKKFLETEK